MIKIECPINNPVALQAIADALKIIASGVYVTTEQLTPQTLSSEAHTSGAEGKTTGAPVKKQLPGTMINKEVDITISDDITPPLEGDDDIDASGVGFGNPPLEGDDDTTPSLETGASGAGADGLPWDGRIHSRTKSVDAKGSYKLMRQPKASHPDKGLWLSYVEAIKVELRLGAPATETPHLVTRKNDVVQTPALETDTTPPLETDTTPVTDGKNFTDIMKFITANKGHITVQDVIKITKEYGVESLPAIKTQEQEIIDAIYQTMVDHVNG